MESKIRQYVEYQFRFDTRDDIEDLKEEIIANLIDRYQQYIDAGKDENSAYIEAIKSMGDFSNDDRNIIPDEYSMKPSIPDILLMSGAILSIFGLIITLINGVTGTIITAISIIFFSGSAYYLYSYSQYVKKEYMDIEKHNLLLVKIFKYMKTSFVFWAVSLSLTLASIIIKIINYIVILNETTDSIDSVMDGFTFTSIDDYKSFIIFNLILFLIILIVLLLIFRNIYERLVNHYYNLTGDKNLHGKIHDSYKFLYDKNENKLIKPLVLSDKFLPVLGLIMLLPYLFLDVQYVYIRYYSNGQSESYKYRNWISSLFDLLLNEGIYSMVIPLLCYILVFILIIISFINKLKRNWILIVAYYICFVTIASMRKSMPYIGQGSLFEGSVIAIKISFSTVNYYSFYMVIILTIILVYRKITYIRFKNKEV